MCARRVVCRFYGNENENDALCSRGGGAQHPVSHSDRRRAGAIVTTAMAENVGWKTHGVGHAQFADFHFRWTGAVCRAATRHHPRAHHVKSNRKRKSERTDWKFWLKKQMCRMNNRLPLSQPAATHCASVRICVSSDVSPNYARLLIVLLFAQLFFCWRW